MYKLLPIFVFISFFSITANANAGVTSYFSEEQKESFNTTSVETYNSWVEKANKTCEVNLQVAADTITMQETEDAPSVLNVFNANGVNVTHTLLNMDGGSLFGGTAHDGSSFGEVKL